MSLEHAVEHATATRRQWRAWAQAQPVLAGLDTDRLLDQVNTADVERTDVLLAALIRLAQHGPHRDEATLLVCRCLLGGIRHRITRYRGRLDRREAFSIFVGALVENILAHNPLCRPRFLASHPLSMPTGRLRRAAAVERTWASYDRNVPEAAGTVPEHGLGIPEGLVSTIVPLAVDAGVVTPADGWLIHATRAQDVPFRHAAGNLGISYEAARKRRQRAERRLAEWLPAHELAGAAAAPTEPAA